jgi:hypothetical protein
LGVAEIIFGETNRLADTAESTDAVPRKLKLEKEIPKKAEGVKLIVIKQQRESNNGGKIRALRDIYEFLLSQNKKWGYCPQYLLAIDAETRLRRREPRSGRISTEINFGLCHMIELSKAATVFVGAKNQSIAFDPNGNPNWDAQTPPMQKVTSLLHGLDGYQWLPGGATLGGFKDTVSAMSAISRKLPGLWVEDTMLTAVAKALGIKTVIDSEVVHTNRCPGPAERQEISLQMERWLMGTEGVRSLIGVSFARKVINDNLTKAISHLLSESIKGRSVNLAYLLKGVTPYLQAKLRSRRQPNDLIADPASFG